MPRPKQQLSVWIPKSKRWLIQAIRIVRKKAEEEGIPLTEGDVVVMALEEMLDRYKSDAELCGVPVIEHRVESKVEMQRTVTCTKDRAWLVVKLDEIVETKKAIGIKTSFSRELFRLASNALRQTAKGAKLDVKILKGTLE